MPLSRRSLVTLICVLISAACRQSPSADTVLAPDSTGTLTPPMPWPAPAPLSARVGDIVVTAATRADSAPTGAPKGAVLYIMTTTLRNAGSVTRVADLRACPMWLSVHESGGWYGQEGRPLAWDQLESGHPCPVEPTAVTLAPGQTMRMSTSVFGHDLLAARVRPNYRSYFHAHVRIDTTTIVVQADSALLTYPTADLVPSATSVLATRDTSRVLRTQISLVNRGELPAYLEYGACATRVLAYRTTAPNAAPVWDSNKRRMWAYGQGVICASYLVITTVAPGATLSPPEFTVDVPLMDILGDSLPDGHYYFRASVGFSNRAPIADIPAGDLDIAFARPPLATTRRSFILEWTAAPVTLSNDVVRAVVTGTVVNANSALVSLAPVECSVQLRVYRDRARRDAAPRSGAPDWTQTICAAPLREKVVYRGQTETYETVVPVRDILGSALPSGTYYFAVVTRAEGMEMTLSAGELSLAR